MPKKVSEMAGCAGCPMARLFPDNPFVPPRITGGKRLIIGEAPGQLESELGEPLIGGAGRWLRGAPGPNGKRYGGMLGKAGVRDEDCTLANVIQCRPPDNIFPTDREARKYISQEDADAAIRHCFDAHVVPLLRGRKWDRLDLLGDKALRVVAGKAGGIHRWRGSPIQVQVRDPNCPQHGDHATGELNDKE